MSVRVWPEAREMLPPDAPPPEREPTVSLEAMWRLAPAVSKSVSESLSESAEPLVTVRLPAWIVVAPVKELTPERVRVSEPLFVRPPAPEIEPAKVAAEV